MDILPDPLIQPITPDIPHHEIYEDEDEEEESVEGDYDKHALDEIRFGFNQD